MEFSLSRLVFSFTIGIIIFERLLVLQESCKIVCKKGPKEIKVTSCCSTWELTVSCYFIIMIRMVTSRMKLNKLHILTLQTSPSCHTITIARASVCRCTAEVCPSSSSSGQYCMLCLETNRN